MSDDEVDDVVVERLLDTIDLQNVIIDDLQSQKNLKKWERQDLKHAKRIRKISIELGKYFTSPDEHWRFENMLDGYDG
jgi:hypothetical protein